MGPVGDLCERSFAASKVRASFGREQSLAKCVVLLECAGFVGGISQSRNRGGFLGEFPDAGAKFRFVLTSVSHRHSVVLSEAGSARGNPRLLKAKVMR